MSDSQCIKLCGFEGCGKESVKKGWCGGHYRQNQRGEILRPLRTYNDPKLPRPLCAFEGCGRKTTKKGLCESHYTQQLLGNPLMPLFHNQRPAGSPPRMICDEAPCPNRDLVGPCHIFRGSKYSSGYGQVRLFGGKTKMAHRYAWEQEVGPIPEGMLIDHQCRVRACCNVDHLRVVTPKVNVTENIIGAPWQIQSAKTHCPQGHPYDEKNTVINSVKYGRMCKKCRVASNRRRRAKIRARSLESSRNTSCLANGDADV